MTVPGYEVRDEIARGGMGRVLAAHDLSFGREVAIKVVLPGPNAAVTAGRFVRESRITGRLTHPGIPPAYQLGELADGSPFLAMKLVRGRTLAALLAERPTVSHDLPRFVAVFEQVCQAVGYAHNQGVIHRDLKPANVMVGAFGEVQVMDWGLAKERGRESPDFDDAPITGPHDATGSTVLDDRTQAGAVMGTPAYMAPEQARGEDVDARADVFALGGLLSSVLVGRAPFWSGDASSTLVLAAAGDTSEVLAALAGCGADADLIDLARRCLAPARADRPADGTTVAALVAAYRTGVEERLRAAERERAATEARAVVEARVAAEAAERRLAERLREARAADGVAGLLDQAKAALEAGDAAQAAPPLAQAEQRAKDDGVTDHADRLGTYQTALTQLRALEKVDNFRWTRDGRSFPPADRVAARWANAFRDIGIIPGETSSADAAIQISTSPIRASLLSALHDWLIRAPSDSLCAVLAAADPDPFRSDVRRHLTTQNKAELVALVERPEWENQPAWLVLAYATASTAPRHQLRRMLERLAVQLPTNFGLMMLLGEVWNFDVGGAWSEEIRWYQAAVALRPKNSAALGGLGSALDCLMKTDGAMAYFLEAIRWNPLDASPHYGLGRAILHKDPARAAAAFQESIRIDPTFAPSHHALGMVLSDQNDIEGAEAEYQEAIRFDPTDHRPHRGRAVLFRKKGDMSRAEAAYREVIRLNPKSPHAIEDFGKFLYDIGNDGGAEAAFQEALRLDPGHAYAHVGLGNLYRGKNQLVEAEAAYRTAIRCLIPPADAHTGLGDVLMAKGDDTGAEDAYREAIRLNPTKAAPHAGLGFALTIKNDWDGASAAFHEAIRLGPTREAGRPDPMGAMPYAGLGNVYRLKGEPRQATDAYREAIQFAPSVAGTHRDLGNALADMKDLDGAEAAFREAIRLDPNAADVHELLGITLFDKKEMKGAEFAFREATRLDPKFANAYTNLGIVLNATGDVAGAEYAYREAIRLDPTNARNYTDLCWILNDKGDLGGTVAVIREAIRHIPNDAMLHNDLGYILREMGDLDGAETALREAIRLDPRMPNPHNGLGLVYESRTDFVRAEAAYREALRHDTRSSYAQNCLGNLYRKLGRTDDAVTAYRAALDIEPNLESARQGLASLLQVSPDQRPSSPRDVRR